MLSANGWASGSPEQESGRPSMILEVEGKSCMGQEKSRQETRVAALSQAKRKAAEQALTYVQSETRVENGVLMSDLVEAYTKAEVKVISQLDEGWVKEEYGGGLADECYRVKIKAEVLPDSKALTTAGEKAFLEDPVAPLTVRLWATKEEYTVNDRIKIYLKGNKPFFALIVYKDSSGNLLQLLPNPYRSDNYFRGGVIYELPSGDDHFTLDVAPPFGEETITLYAATAPLGALKLSQSGGVYSVKDAAKDVGTLLRGVKTSNLQPDLGASGSAVEFAEAPVTINIKQQ